MQTIVDATLTIKEIWNIQHPIMHKWFMFSAISFGILSAFLFIAI